MVCHWSVHESWVEATTGEYFGENAEKAVPNHQMAVEG
jgi:hypothetical protein